MKITVDDDALYTFGSDKYVMYLYDNGYWKLTINSNGHFWNSRFELCLI